ncbi:heme uptake protein IsdC [Listeria ivanovii]|uniref:NEAT domain-containing protein n=3 Tax=Listeria ivanovii TaxID=1638 RepID=G2ZE08_LISIP|nr:heme uptake protein IsdC [Listeria ivanovii]AHI56699.1 heme uptake protein IsdC [Listeria ivanovii WSLC3009]AIS66116.1 heme uptake protein IsdC [Listeria ivanovii subsp. ivanovii]MBC1760354.1 heme uptake protein IsdC [Listeria ivanovii]MCJ1716916.1 heme uptake protein IsdC [Listeria ivanovii]MCJ1722128.1 heme uptake protein IsdC [Listeria ivanovii]
MKKIAVFVAFIVLFSFSFLSSGLTAQAAINDGTYSINYTVLQGDSGSASMANDYFDKPATVTINGGKFTVSLQVNHSKWITGLWVEGSAVSVTSSSTANDTRKVQFPVSTLSSPVKAKIKVDIDDDGLNYHHEYQIQLKFDESSAKSLAAAIKSSDDGATKEVTTNESKTEVANPKSSDSSQMFLYGIVFVAAGIGLVLLKRRASFK